MRNQVRVVPSLPGDASDSALLQAFNNRRIFSRGYSLTTNGAGSPQSFDQIKFPGTARLFEGLTLLDTSGDPTNRFTLSINNEKVIDGATWAEYTKTSIARAAGLVTGSSFNGMFYRFPRALSGNDAVEVTYISNTGGILLPTFYFRTLASADTI